MDANGCTISLKTNPVLASIRPHVCLQSQQLIIDNLETSNRISLSLVDPDFTAAASWLQSALNCVCSLVSSTRAGSSVVEGKVKATRQNIEKTFSNKSHLLVVEKKSLEYLHQECCCQNEDFDTFSLRFRPNLIVETDTEMTPFAEDNWELMEINGLKMATKVGCCTRCAMIQINPMTGKPACLNLPTREGVLKRLATVKKINGMDNLISFGVLFNINLDVSPSDGMNLRCGQRMVFCVKL